MTHGSLRQHEDQGVEWKRDRRKNHVVWQLGSQRGSQEFPRDVVGWDIVAYEQGRLAVNRSQRRIGPGLVFVDVDVVLHRSVRR